MKSDPQRCLQGPDLRRVVPALTTTTAMSSSTQVQTGSRHRLSCVSKGRATPEVSTMIRSGRTRSQSICQGDPATYRTVDNTHSRPRDINIGFFAFTQEGLVNAQSPKFIRDHCHPHTSTLGILQEMTHQSRLPSTEETWRPPAQEYVSPPRFPHSLRTGVDLPAKLAGPIAGAQHLAGPLGQNLSNRERQIARHQGLHEKGSDTQRLGRAPQSCCS